MFNISIEEAKGKNFYLLLNNKFWILLLFSPLEKDKYLDKIEGLFSGLITSFKLNHYLCIVKDYCYHPDGSLTLLLQVRFYFFFSIFYIFYFINIFFTGFIGCNNWIYHKNRIADYL